MEKEALPTATDKGESPPCGAVEATSRSTKRATCSLMMMESMRTPLQIMINKSLRKTKTASVRCAPDAPMHPYMALLVLMKNKNSLMDDKQNRCCFKAEMNWTKVPLLSI